MSTNAFKNFVPLHISPHFFKTLPLISEMDPGPPLAVDPSGGEWGRIGFIPPLGEDLVETFGDQQAYLMAVQFNERILPSAVRDEKLAERCADLAEQQGYRVSKKQYAQVKDEVIFDLLPRAFIRRSTVQVMFVRPNLMFVFTSSAKKVEDIIALFLDFVSAKDGFVPNSIQVQDEATVVLATIASEMPSDSDVFTAGDSIVLKGEDKKAVRIKGRDVYSEEVQDLLASDAGYHPTELEVLWRPNETPTILCTISETLYVKRVVFAEPVITGRTEGGDDVLTDFRAFAWMTATYLKDFMRDLIATMGGLKSDDAPAPSTQEEDDEL